MLGARLVPVPALASLAAGTLPDRQDGDRSGRVDALIRREMKVQQFPAVAVENGKVALPRPWGHANLKTGFTATALGLLVEEGKVGPDDPFGKYVEKTPEGWARITLRMLLSHTSGLPIDGSPASRGHPSC